MLVDEPSALMKVPRIKDRDIVLYALPAFSFLIWNGNARPKRSMVQASPDFICHFFMRAIPNVTNFRIMFIRFMFVKCACFVLYQC